MVFILRVRYGKYKILYFIDIMEIFNVQYVLFKPKFLMYSHALRAGRTKNIGLNTTLRFDAPQYLLYNFIYLYIYKMKEFELILIAFIGFLFVFSLLKAVGIHC